MSDEDVAGAVESATVLQFKAKPARKPRAKNSRPANDHDDGVPLDDGDYDAEQLNAEFAYLIRGGTGVILRELPDASAEDRIQLLRVQTMKDLFANRFTEVRSPKDEKIKKKTWFERWWTSPDRRQFDGVEFFPNSDGAKGTRNYYNLWRGFSVVPERREGATYKTFKDHLLTNVAGGDAELSNWILGWIAHMVQRPRERYGTALVLRGKMGAGKSKLGEVIGSLIRSHYFPIDDARYLTGNFNNHMASCLLLQADEAVWAGDKAAEGRLKGLVTSESQMIEAKGVDAIKLKNYVRLIMTSNEDWVVPAGKDERRFMVCDVASHAAQNHDYFGEMDAELDAGGRELLLADLLAFDLSSVNLRQIPKTEALLEQKVRSLDPVDSWWLDRLMSGATTRGGDVWSRLILSDDLYDDYLAVSERTGVRRKSDKVSWAKRMHRLLPNLKDRRGSDGGFGRRQMYELPSLKEARSAFEISLTQRVDWGASDPDRSGDATWNELNF